jgi:hypothetical protein
MCQANAAMSSSMVWAIVKAVMNRPAKAQWKARIGRS